MGVALSNINEPPRCCKPLTACSTKCLTCWAYERPVNSGSERHLQRRRPAAMQDEYDELGQQMSDMLQNTLTAAPTCSVFPAPATPVLTAVPERGNFPGGRGIFRHHDRNISSQLNTLMTDLSAISNSLVRIRLTPRAPQAFLAVLS